MEPKQPASSDEPADDSPAKSGWKLKATEIIDIVVKLVPAAAVLMAAFIANNFQAAMSTTNLLSQREQADSTLRANMFQGLINPILGSQKDGQDIPIDREQLMVELLALNFHESFELKPLMLHVEHRRAQQEIKEKFTDEEKTKKINQLRSIARRVLQRQLAMISKGASDSRSVHQTCIYRIDLEGEAKAGGAQEYPSPPPCSTIKRTFRELIEIKSPNGAYSLYLEIYPPHESDLQIHPSHESTSWEEQSFQVELSVFDHKHKKSVADHDFMLTWFDFPFTDNTVIADGTRFSLVINAIDAEKKSARFNLVWFPQDYFSARERPINHSQFREKLGITLKQ